MAIEIRDSKLDRRVDQLQRSLEALIGEPVPKAEVIRIAVGIPAKNSTLRRKVDQNRRWLFM